MGAFSEFIRLKSGSERSKRLLFIQYLAGEVMLISISVMGEKSEFSPGSSFDILLQKNAKIIFSGTSDFVETFVHLAEESGRSTI